MDAPQTFASGRMKEHLVIIIEVLVPATNQIHPDQQELPEHCLLLVNFQQLHAQRTTTKELQDLLGQITIIIIGLLKILCLDVTKAANEAAQPVVVNFRKARWSILEMQTIRDMC